MLTVEQIDAHLAELRSHASAALIRRQHVALHLTSTPKDPPLRKTLAGVDKAIAELNAEISVFEAARTAATENEAAEQRAEQLRQVKASRCAALAAARERAQLGVDIEAAIEQLTPLLEAWHNATAACAGHAASVASGCYSGVEFASRAELIGMAARGEHGGAREALVAALISTANRSGMALRFDESCRVAVSLPEAAMIDADKLRLRLDEAVARMTTARAVIDGKLHDVSHIPSRDELVAFSAPA